MVTSASSVGSDSTRCADFTVAASIVSSGSTNPFIALTLSASVIPSIDSDPNWLRPVLGLYGFRSTISLI